MNSKNFRLEGLVAATFTPFDKNGQIDYARIKPYADFLVAEGVYGVFVCGSTGESLSMTVEERKKCLEAWVDAIGGRAKVIAHVGGNCLVDSVTLAAHAESVGVDAIGAVAPSYFRPSTVADLVNFYKPIGEAAGNTPLYCYHIPSMTGIGVSMPAFLEAASEQIPTLVGIKFTSNNFMEMMECINFDGGRYDILNGFDEMLLCGLAMGCKGGVGSTYNYSLKTYQGLCDCFFAGDIEGARRYQQESIDIVKVIIKHGGGVRGGKAVMKAIGIDCGNCRVPFAPYTDAEIETLREELREIGYLK